MHGSPAGMLGEDGDPTAQVRVPIARKERLSGFMLCSPTAAFWGSIMRSVAFRTRLPYSVGSCFPTRLITGVEQLWYASAAATCSPSITPPSESQIRWCTCRISVFLSFLLPLVLAPLVSVVAFFAPVLVHPMRLGRLKVTSGGANVALWGRRLAVVGCIFPLVQRDLRSPFPLGLLPSTAMTVSTNLNDGA